MGIQDEIEEIEQEIRETPYNKSTEEHIGRLKSKLSQLREKKQKLDEGSGGGGGYSIPKTGDATVALVGMPSVGKSTLLNNLTNADSETGSYEFTTLEVVPGMLKHRGVNIQLLDVPGLIEGASGGRGRGREVLSVIRSSDLLLFLVDVFEPEGLTKLRDELYRNGIRLDEEPPNVLIEKKGKGGIDVRMGDGVSLGVDAVRETAKEHGFVNAHIVIREDITLDHLVDAFMDNRVYIDSLVAVNKIDLADDYVLEEVKEFLRGEGVDSAVGISAEKGLGLDVLKDRILDGLNLTRVYLKPQGGEPDMDDALVMEGSASVEDVARKLHDDFKSRFRYARVWGESASHDGQRVGLEHTLNDGDVLSIITKK